MKGKIGGLGFGSTLALLIAACGPPPPTQAGPVGYRVPAVGSDATLDVGGWNVEWFGSLENGPSDEALQLRNAREVFLGAGLDIWGVEEIVDRAHWGRLLAELPGYAGILSSDSAVAGGPEFYAADEQKVGFIYRRDVATPLGARLILTEHDYDVGRRPPLEVRFRITIQGRTREAVVIVMHAKSSQDTSSWQRRQRAAAALKSHLDRSYRDTPVLVIGDWNDDIDTSIGAGLPSPFRNFVEDSARYRFPTRALSEAHISSMMEWPEMIDHHMITDELFAAYIPGSAQLIRADRHIPGYGETTSDHFPVVTRYDLRRR